MPRWSLKRPDRDELGEVLQRVVSISALARHYHITFTTAKKWIVESGLEAILSDEEHLARIKKLELESSPRARQRRIDEELEVSLKDYGDRKLLARAIVDEFSMRFTHRRCFSWERYVLRLDLVMYDLPPVEEIARLTGTPLKMRRRAAKNGAMVPFGHVMILGYRAFRILELTRPYLTGQKAFQADIALRAGGGGISRVRIHLQKEVYMDNLLTSVGFNSDYWKSRRRHVTFTSHF